MPRCHQCREVCCEDRSFHLCLKCKDGLPACPFCGEHPSCNDNVHVTCENRKCCLFNCAIHIMQWKNRPNPIAKPDAGGKERDARR